MPRDLSSRGVSGISGKAVRRREDDGKGLHRQGHRGSRSAGRDGLLALVDCRCLGYLGANMCRRGRGEAIR